MIRIDKKKIYQVGDYAFKNFIILDENEIKMVWTWRNDERIRKWMSNNDEIPFNNHLIFIDSLQNRDDKFYWLVYKNDNPIAVLDIIDVDYEVEVTEPGYYLNPNLLNSGEGLFFNFYFRNFLFNLLGFKYVKGNIKIGNDRAYTLSTFFGVNAVGIDTLEDGEHLIMRGSKEDFNKVTEKGLLKSFVRFSKNLDINWDDIVTGLSK